MRKKLCAVITALGLLLPFPQSAKADLFGGDVMILAQILANAIQQLAQLQEILRSGNDTLGLLQDINRGLNDSLRMAETFEFESTQGFTVISDKWIRPLIPLKLFLALRWIRL